MATYRLFSPSVVPETLIPYSDPLVIGVSFALIGGGNWFEGYWWYVMSGAPTTIGCALWSVTSTTGGVVVPGSIVTSETLTEGEWNYIPLDSPVQLAPSYDAASPTDGSVYIAAIGFTGSFPSTTSSFNSGDTYEAGITNGPLVAYSGTGGSNPAPYGIFQGCYSGVGANPAVDFPDNADSAGDGASNFWVDVQISDTAPVGYSGSYRLWPNKGDSNPDTVVDSAVAYNVATEIDITSPVVADYVHYFVPPGASTASGLATRADIWNISTQTAVTSIVSPSWTTESGSAVTIGSAGQWVRAPFPSGVTIPTGKYRVGVYNANGGAAGWNSKDASTGYFTTGVAENGIVNGPFSAPNLANAQTGTYYPGTGTGSTNAQPVFAYTGTDSFPDITTGNNPAQVYWVDLEATPAAVTTIYTVNLETGSYSYTPLWQD